MLGLLEMKYDHVTYSKRVDEILRDAGAEVEVFAEVDENLLVGYSLIRESSQSLPSGKNLPLNLPLVYLSTGIHGDEPAGPESLLNLLENGLLDRELSFCICPMLNPTGFELGTRENVLGRDLNRDYFYLRNPEVEGHVKWLENKMAKRVPDLFISLHEDWESEGFYFYEINLMNNDAESLKRYQLISKQIEAVMPMEPADLIDDHPVYKKGWIYHRAEADFEKCWPEAIYMAKKGCPMSFTFESPSSKNIEHRVTAQVTAVNSLLDSIYTK